MSLLTALALTSFVAAPEPKADPAKVARATLQGEWKVTALSKGEASETELENLKVLIKADKLHFIRGEREEEIVFILDPKAEPSAIDIVKDTNVFVKGIYKLEKDKLTICLGPNGGDRPKEFKSAKEPETRLMVLERVKK
jgi:uncharacterized protein (TIGR03067 family)